MKRFFIMAVLCICFLTVGCAGGESSKSGGTAVHEADGGLSDMTDGIAESASEADAGAVENASEAGTGETLDELAEKAGGAVTLKKEMLVYRCNISIDTLDYQTSLSDFKKLLKEYDCFIETENYSDNGDDYSYYYIEESGKHSRYTATVRVPSEKYESFLDSMGSIGDIRSKNSNVENLNREYTDTDTALKIYREQEKRYIAMIKDADDSYALQLQQQLTELEIKIAQLESRKNQIETDVAYSYVDLTLREVQKYSAHGKTDTFTMRLKDHVSDSWDTFLNVMETLLTIFIYVWYYLVIVLVIVFFAVRQSKKNGEKRRKAMQQRQASMPAATGQQVGFSGLNTQYMPGQRNGAQGLEMPAGEGQTVAAESQPGEEGQTVAAKSQPGEEEQNKGERRE